MWMIRAGRGAAWIEDFLDSGLAAIGWNLANDMPLGCQRDAVLTKAEDAFPNLRPAQRASAVGQIHRFLSEMEVGDRVCTYDPGLRRYCLGTLLGEDGLREHPLGRWRKVDWTSQVARDALSSSTRNSLGAIMTLFRISSEASAELLSAAVPLGEPLSGDTPPSHAPIRVRSEPTVVPASGDDESELDGILDKAGDLIDDLLIQLEWDEMQELVAGVLRAMGYRTQVAAAGPDRGVDIFASPDGLGLEEPRVFVEVKHRRESMSAGQVRAFMGGRQVGDRCLYVSTGGFTREARYEAERSTIPVTLIDLPRLRALLLDYYDRLDPATSALVPLQRMYWPVRS